MNLLKFALYSLCEKCTYSELFWSVFSRIRAVRMRENTDQNNSKYGQFWRLSLSKNECSFLLICSNSFQRLNFVDVATGSLGQGLSCACGMAYTAKYFDKARQVLLLAAIFKMVKDTTRVILRISVNHLCKMLTLQCLVSTKGSYMLKISPLVLLIPLVNIQTIQELQFEFGVLFHSLKLGDHVQILPLIILPPFQPEVAYRKQ